MKTHALYTIRVPSLWKLREVGFTLENFQVVEVAVVEVAGNTSPPLLYLRKISETVLGYASPERTLRVRWLASLAVGLRPHRLRRV